MSKRSAPLIGILLLAWACGTTAPVQVTVIVTPYAESVHVARSIQFNATTSPTSGVVWSLSGAGCSGAACGTISNTGLYTAPQTVPSSPYVTVTATSLDDPGASGSATITVFPAIVVRVSPSNPLVAIGSTQPFTATVENAIDETGVTWTVAGPGGTGPEYGLIWATGSYTAPPVVPADPVVTVTATSVEDPAISGSTPVTIHASLISVEWTWMSGRELPGQAGVYGIKGLSDPSNVPGARDRSVTWTDSHGDLWLFGGVGLDKDGATSAFNDLWKYDTTTLEWTWVSGSNTVLEPDVSYGIKGVPDPQNLPGPRVEAVSWIDPEDNLWLFGGDGMDSTAEWHGDLNDLWKFDPVTLEWTWVSGCEFYGQKGVYGTRGAPGPSNVPGGRRMAVSWLGPDGSLWLFGGWGLDSSGLHAGDLNDLWKFDPATLGWTWISGSDLHDQPGVYGIKGTASPSNVPGGRESSVSWTDAAGKAWLFGGYGYVTDNGPLPLNDLWRFDPVTLEWTWMSGPREDGYTPRMAGVYGVKGMGTTANCPGARSKAVSWTDPGGDLWLFGGSGYASVDHFTEHIGCGDLNDLWKLDMSNLVWTWVSGSDIAYQAGVYGTKGMPAPTNVPCGRYDAVSWVDAAGRLWLFGGALVYSPYPFSNLLNDLWRCDW